MIIDRKKWHNDENVDYQRELSNCYKTMVIRQKWKQLEKEQGKKLTPEQNLRRFIEMKVAESKKYAT